MKRSKKSLLATISLLTLLVGAGVWFWHIHYGNSGAQTTSTLPSAQNKYKGDNRHTTDVVSSSNDKGGAVDNKGDSNTNTSGGSVSASGLVTVLSPVSNQLFGSGSVLRGRVNNLTKVQYRVVDDVEGVVAQGSLDVVNGSFSGTMQFTSKGTTGRVDVFTYDQSYDERNNVQVPVHFK